MRKTGIPARGERSESAPFIPTIAPGAQRQGRYGLRLRFGAPGMAGVIAVTVSEQMERLFLGRLPVYAAKSMVVRLCASRSSETETWVSGLLGLLARSLYGGTLGFLFARTRANEGYRWLAFTGGVLLLETALFPVVGVTPPIREWKTLERVLLPVHVAAFSLAARSVLQAAGRKSPPSRL